MITDRFVLADIARPSGGLAMLAIDQREALRNMFTAAGAPAPVPDSALTAFKLAAARVLSPFASGVLVDKQFSYDAIVHDGCVVENSALIVAADAFHPGNGIPVDEVTIDTEITPERARDDGARAMKLLVLWRSDEDPAARRSVVDRFVRECHAQGLLAIIEPVVRPPRHGASIDREHAILMAAGELGDTDADLYKGEMPYGGDADDDTLLDACRSLDSKLSMPWVILSSGVKADLFPNSVRMAIRAGASGFLAGRAVWASVIGARNPVQMLADISAPRLRRLGEIVDEEIAGR
ncbi:hypothetical protein ACFQ23_04650 [Schaalia naturae]|jgi:sulfofructosephosphate aldolase|uniref:Aldolase n=1 Tax=Schaalia naturae TaxID=635203 RepID=A0ABW2SP36_9ACTO